MTAPRRFTGDTLVIASHNAGKVREIADLFGPYVANFISAGDLGLPEPEETGDSFIANAELKAKAAAAAGHVALADDSGLVVPALGGDPGIHSARWAGPEKDFALAMSKVEEGLADQANRTAYFVCALSLAWPDGHVETVEGRCYGTLVWPPQGGQGFGYDPMFRPDGYGITFGEMKPAKKHEMSHRADAFQQLVERCFQ